MKALLKIANGTNNGNSGMSIGSSVAPPAARNDVSKAGRNGAFNSRYEKMKLKGKK